MRRARTPPDPRKERPLSGREALPLLLKPPPQRCPHLRLDADAEALRLEVQIEISRALTMAHAYFPHWRSP